MNLTQFSLSLLMQFYLVCSRPHSSSASTFSTTMKSAISQTLFKRIQPPQYRHTAHSFQSKARTSPCHCGLRCSWEDSQWGRLSTMQMPQRPAPQQLVLKLQKPWHVPSSELQWSIDPSQPPTSVPATMRGTLSRSVQPQPSRAPAT